MGCLRQNMDRKAIEIVKNNARLLLDLVLKALDGENKNVTLEDELAWLVVLTACYSDAQVLNPVTRVDELVKSFELEGSPYSMRQLDAMASLAMFQSDLWHGRNEIGLAQLIRNAVYDCDFDAFAHYIAEQVAADRDALLPAAGADYNVRLQNVLKYLSELAFAVRFHVSDAVRVSFVKAVNELLGQISASGPDMTCVAFRSACAVLECSGAAIYEICISNRTLFDYFVSACVDGDHCHADIARIAADARERQKEICNGDFLTDSNWFHLFVRQRSHYTMGYETMLKYIVTNYPSRAQYVATQGYCLQDVIREARREARRRS